MATPYQTLRFENGFGLSIELWEYEDPWLFFKRDGKILDRIPIRQEFVSLFDEINSKIIDYEKLEKHCEALEEERDQINHENDGLRCEYYELKESLEHETLTNMEKTIENQRYIINQYEERIRELRKLIDKNNE